LPAPYYPREGVPPFYLSVAGSLTLALAVGLQRPGLGVLGGLLLLAGGLGFWYVMAVSWIRAAAFTPQSAP
jgi:hypothetical protein